MLNYGKLSRAAERSLWVIDVFNRGPASSALPPIAIAAWRGERRVAAAVLSPAKEVRQSGKVDCQPARLVLGEQLGR